MAQRRLRALGMLQAVGATDRHVRLVLLANGAVVGIIAAVTGAVVALAGWVAFVPRLETIVEHRIATFSLPWWEVATAIVLAVRDGGRGRVVAGARSRARARRGRAVRPSGHAQAGPPARGARRGAPRHRPGRDRPVAPRQDTAADHRWPGPHRQPESCCSARSPSAALAVVGRRSPLAIRLALRDLARYRARSGAALAAISLVTGIVAAIAISAAAAAQNEGPSGEAGWTNLPANQLMVYLSPGGSYALPAILPQLSASRLHHLEGVVGEFAGKLHSQDLRPA